MVHTLRTSVIVVAAGFAWLVGGMRVEGAEPQAAGAVSVETVDGRALRGVVDARTDERTLWLRQEEDSIVLTTPVGWSELATAAVEGESIDVAELRERRAELASEGRRWLFAEVEVPVAKTQAGEWASYVGRSLVERRVRNIDIVHAGLVNLDRDVAPDGFEVAIVAVGDDGAPVAVRGSLRAELHGERRPLDRERREEVEFDELGRWVQRVRAEDFIDGVATYCLPFRTTSPEWEFDLMPDAALTVQLGATGHGNFSASAPVALREFNPLRDDLQQYRGTRFLPNEVEGWRPQRPFGPQEGLWQWWGR